MFVRRNRNRSGTVSVQVLEKKGRSNRLVRTFGTSSDEEELRRYELEARMWIDEQAGPAIFDLDGMEAIRTASDYDAVFSGISQRDLVLSGPGLVYGRLFDRIGYGRVRTSDSLLFRSLVLTRLYKPGSKLRTRDYLYYFMGVDYGEDRIYRYLDRLCVRKEAGNSPEEQEASERAGVKYQVEQVTYEWTESVMEGRISVVFYDTTTMYFESREDEMRVPGWSKDGKSSNPQVVLGLLVSCGGNPIGYEIHRGNRYEGDTLLPIIRKLQKRYGFGKPVVVADAGLLSRANMKALEDDGYEYILGARLRSMDGETRKEVLSLSLCNGQSGSVSVGDGRRMVVTMSDARARKNAADRSRGLERLEKRIGSGRLTKASLNNRGYNRFLTMEGNARIIIDRSRIEEDARFDGLKGYITNSSLPDSEIVDNYRYLFMIERAFRFNKTDLDIRPVYHRLFNRIEAHVCICFTAYTIMLELERILKASGSGITLSKAMFLTEKIYRLNYVNPFNRKKMSVIIKTDEDKEINELLSIIDAACKND